MSTATRQLVSATMTDDGARLVLRSKKDQAFIDFVHTLPAARWNGSQLCWTCDATPASAWRLMNHCPLEVEADDSVLSLASRFTQAIDDSFMPDLQPQIRKADSWRHQLDMYHFADQREGSMLAADMGCGKSKPAVDLIVNRGCRKTLILCPVSVRGVWRRELERWAAKPLSVLVLEKGTSKDKVRRAEDFLKRAKDPAVIVVNYETARTDIFAKWSIGQEWDCVILDESHRCKAHNSAVSDYVGALGKRAKFRLCLTGTPMPHSPLDLFGQFRFLDRGLFGSSFHHFRNRYARINPMFPGKVDEWLNQDELKDRFALLAYRVTNEVLDLPEAMHHERRCSLNERAQEVYAGLEKELIADLGNGVVTATNALVRLLRLQQVTSGFVREDESERDVELDDAKAILLADILDDLSATEPVVVFCRFRHDLDIVSHWAEKLGRRYGELSGRRRDGLTDKATMSEGVDLLGTQIQSGGVGIDLTRARYAIYFSLGFSLGDYEQSLARLHRPGQERPVHYYHLLASGTVDEAVYGALKSRKNLVENVLEALKR